MEKEKDKEKDRLIVFDTTLRDGEQSPGASMTLEEKVKIAKMLELLKVDIIEAGFASASAGDFAAVSAVASAVKDSKVCSLARAKIDDIENAAKALKVSDNSRIHTFIATSAIHMQHKLQMTAEQVLEKAVSAVKAARNLVADVEFSLEDAVRSDFDFMCKVIEATIDAGAKTINIPDTVGYATPESYGELIAKLIANVPNSDKAVFSAHCHNDLGLAVANSLAAVRNGARQVECTINGLGERAGNAALEELVMAIKVRKDFYPVYTQIDNQRIVNTSKLVSSVTGFTIQPNKAIVGANSFAHEAGIHQDGILKHRETYEIMHAKDVGWQDNKLILGKHSGKNAVKQRMQALGWHLTASELQELFVKFKNLADEKHQIFDEDLLTLINVEHKESTTEIAIKDLEYSSNGNLDAVAKIILNIAGVTKVANSSGDGVIDALFKSIKQCTNTNYRLKLYQVSNITGGTDSQAEVLVRLLIAGELVNGVAVNVDLVLASALAYINALNNSKINRKKPS